MAITQANLPTRHNAEGQLLLVDEAAQLRSEEVV